MTLISTRPQTRAQHDYRIAQKREAMRILLSLNSDVDEAREVLQLALELLQNWMGHRGWPANE